MSATFTGGGALVNINGSDFVRFLSNGTIRFASTTTAQILMVAGGGGGGGGLGVSYESGGGGGAGGVADGGFTFIGGTTYTITVGAGGSGGNGAAYEDGGATPNGGGSGQDTIIQNNSTTEIVALVKGGGRGGHANGTANAENGGSGGGGPGWGSGFGSVITGLGSGLTQRGNNGGSSGSGGGNCGGGGGGASSAGGNGNGLDGNVNVSGGNGFTWSYTLATYGGGGGPGISGTTGNPTGGSGGPGGSGGGGRGAGSSAQAVAGTNGTGGGGGGGAGAGNTSYSNGASGGSGIVLIKYVSSVTGSAPTDVTATAISGTSNIQISYGASTGGVPAVSAYYYKLNGGSYISAGASPFTISGLTAGTSYSVIVYAYNSNWPTPYIGSTAAVTTTYGNGSAPTITNVLSGFTQLTVTYSASINGVPPVTSYYYSVSGGIYNGTVKTSAGTSPFTIYGLVAGTSYTTIVYAYNLNWPTQYVASAPFTQSTALTYYSNNSVDLITYFYLPNNTGEPNNIANTGFLLNGTNAFSNIPLYKGGARNGIGFQLTGADIGYYFQPNDATLGLGYCYNTNGIYNRGSVAYSQITASSAVNIWTNAASTSTQGNAHWLYYSFYYSGSSYSGVFHSAINNYGYLYFNTIDKGLITARPSINNAGNTAGIAITLVNGLNYVRVATYNNTVGTTACSFIAAIYDGASNVVAVSSQHWTWTSTPSPYNVLGSYYNTLGAIVFNFASTDRFPIPALTMSGSVYYTGGPFQIANYITGNAPANTTYTPASFTAVGTYSFSNITVNLPNGYVLGPTSGTFTILALIPANLTLSGSVTYTGSAFAIANYITGAPVGTTYNPSTFTNLGTYSFSNITVTLPANYTPGTYSGSFVINTSVVNLTLGGSLYSYQLPVNTSSYITGAPAGTTYTPTQITAAGTYTFSNITVNLPYGYARGTYSGTLTVASSTPVNLTFSGTTYYLAGTNSSTISSPSVAVSSLVSSSPSVSVTYSPSNFTTAGPKTNLTGITPTFGNGYSLGTVSGTAYIYPYLDFVNIGGNRATTSTIPSWCTKIYFVFQINGTSSTSSGGGVTSFYSYSNQPNFFQNYDNLQISANKMINNKNYHVVEKFAGFSSTYANTPGFIRYTFNNGAPIVTNGTGGRCYYGNYNVPSGTTTFTAVCGDYGGYIQFNDANNSNVPSTASGGNLIYSSKDGNGTTPGSQNGITIPSGATNISSSYGAGGTPSVSPGTSFIRTWFMT